MLPTSRLSADDAHTPRAGPPARLSSTVLSLCGWQTVLARPVPDKAVIIFYPHTSNWDFVVGLMAKWALEFDVHWVGKDSLFHGPFGHVFGAGAAFRRSGVPGRGSSRA